MTSYSHSVVTLGLLSSCKFAITTLCNAYRSVAVFVYDLRGCNLQFKKHPLWPAVFWHFFHKRLRILNQFFTHLLCVSIYAKLQIFIQLSEISTKLCHIKHDYLVHIICTKCLPSAETHAFRRLQKLLMALLIVVCGKSFQIWYFYNVNKHAGYDVTSTVTSFAQ